MKFLVDAQLPIRLSKLLISLGYDSIHTLELPNRNFTSDKEITKLSLLESRIVITKDSDFYNSFLQRSEPYKLIFLRVGNLSTNELIGLFEKNINKIMNELVSNFVIEISTKNITTII